MVAQESQELLERERLHEVGADTRCPIAGANAPGHRGNRQRGHEAMDNSHCEFSAHVIEVQVHEREAHSAVGSQLDKGLLQAGSDHHMVSRAAEQPPKPALDALVVVDYEDPVLHSGILRPLVERASGEVSALGTCRDPGWMRA